MEYFEKAKEKGVHVVGSCGFDSVPADMGTIFLQDNFKGMVWQLYETVKAVDVFDLLRSGI